MQRKHPSQNTSARHPAEDLDGVQLTQQLVIDPGYAITMCDLWLAHAEAFRNKVLTKMGLASWTTDHYPHSNPFPSPMPIEPMLHRCSLSLIAIARHYRRADRPLLKVELLEGMTHLDPFLIKRENWRDVRLFVHGVKQIAESEREACRLGSACVAATSVGHLRANPLPPADAALVVGELHQACVLLDFWLGLELGGGQERERIRAVVRDAIMSDLGPLDYWKRDDSAPPLPIAQPDRAGLGAQDAAVEDCLKRLQSDLEQGGTAVEQFGRLTEVIALVTAWHSSLPTPFDGLAMFDVMPDEEIETFLRELRTWLPAPKTVERILAEYGSMGSGGDASQEESDGGPGSSLGPRDGRGRTTRRRGRPADTDREADRRVAELMQQYRDRKVVADLLKISAVEVERATDRHRVRRRKK